MVRRSPFKQSPFKAYVPWKYTPSGSLRSHSPQGVLQSFGLTLNKVFGLFQTVPVRSMCRGLVRFFYVQRSSRAIQQRIDVLESRMQQMEAWMDSITTQESAEPVDTRRYAESGKRFDTVR